MYLTLQSHLVFYLKPGKTVPINMQMYKPPVHLLTTTLSKMAQDISFIESYTAGTYSHQHKLKFG
jgi:hypothetical protein